MNNPYLPSPFAKQQAISRRDAFADTPPNTDIYFPFGKQRKMLSQYVKEQLLGDNTKKNQQILLKFRREAELRKHRRWNSINYTSPLQAFQSPSASRMASLQINDRLAERPKQNYRFASYQPPLSRPSPIFFTEKTRPPIYRYVDQLKGSSRAQSSSHLYQKSNLHNSCQKKCQSLQGSKLYSILMNTKNNKHAAKYNSKEIYLNKKPSQKKYMHRALSKIKQIAKQKRENTNSNTNNPENSQTDTDTSALLDQAELQNQKKILQCKHMAKQLKKLKKYRKIIQLQQNIYKSNAR